MGKSKALLDLKGKPFIKYIADTVTGLFEEVHIIADESSQFEFLDMPVVSDVYKNCGPLGGIHSALVHASIEKVFILTCDAPLIQSEFILFLLDELSNEDVLVPSIQSFVHPLCGVYSKSCLPAIEKRLSSKQYSVLNFLHTQKTKVAELPLQRAVQFEQSFLNVNTPEEYQNLISHT